MPPLPYDYRHLVLEDTAANIAVKVAAGTYPKKFVFDTTNLVLEYLTNVPGPATQVIRLISEKANVALVGPLTINPTVPTPPLVLGANGQGQLVTGLNADQLDGQHGSYWANLNWTKSGSNLYPTASSDLVGVGTATPQAKLHVEGDIVGKADSTSNLGSATRKYAALYLASKIYYSSDLEFDSAGAKVTIGTTGYVGIGTAPQAKLHVEGDIIAGSIASSGGLTFSTLTTVNVAATPYSLTPTTTRIEINNTTAGPVTSIIVNLQASALAEGTVIVVYYKNDNGSRSLTLSNTQGSDWITLQGNSMLFIKTSDGWSPIVKSALN